MTPPPGPVELEGVVVVEAVAAATRSGRTAAVLHTDDGRALVLRRRGAPGLDLDPTLAELAGRRVRATGDALPETFLADTVQPVDPVDPVDLGQHLRDTR